MRLSGTKATALHQYRGLGNQLWDLAGNRPSLDVRFAENKSLVDATTGLDLVTFSRTSDGTATNSSGNLIVVPAGSPRFDHNPVTGESLGLLVEEQRTNLCLQSEDFSTTWGTANYTVTANATTAPNGTVTADKLIRSALDATASVTQNVTVTANTAYNYSVFVKASEWSKVGLREGSVTGNYVTFDLSNGTIVSTSVATGAITALANGWYRISMQMTTGAAQTTYGVRLIPLPDSYASGTPSYSFAGDNTSGLFVWGAQLESGAFPTSYIPTTDTAATRSADVASISGSNFSSWYRQDAQTWFGEYAPVYNASATVPANTLHLLQVHNTAAVSNNYAIRGANNSVNQEFVARNPTAGAQFIINTGIGFGVAGTNRKVSFGIDSSTLNASTNGTINSAANNTAALMATHDILFIGSGTGGAPPYQLNGHIRRITYWPQRLSNSTLQSITQ